jgi:hypothetical protein
MVDVTVSEDVQLGADAVWSVIGDFGGIRKWATVVDSESVAQTADGTVRTLTMAGGRVVREAQAFASPYSYTYTILDQPEPGDYRGTIAVIPLDEAHSRIELITHVTMPPGQEEDAAARYTRFLQGNLKAMKMALGIS